MKIIQLFFPVSPTPISRIGKRIIWVTQESGDTIAVFVIRDFISQVHSRITKSCINWSTNVTVKKFESNQMFMSQKQNVNK